MSTKCDQNPAPVLAKGRPVRPLNSFLGLLAIAAALASTAAADPCDVSLFEFEVEDQFENEHTHRELLGTISVLVWADREASDWSGEWSDMLSEALRGQIAAGDVQVRGWAHTRGAPFFVKGRIRRSFPDDPEHWTFLDWSGDFKGAYETEEHHVNVFVFDREGCLVARETGQEVDPQVLARIVRAAQDVLVEESGGDVPGEIQPGRRNGG